MRPIAFYKKDGRPGEFIKLSGNWFYLIDGILATTSETGLNGFVNRWAREPWMDNARITEADGRVVIQRNGTLTSGGHNVQSVNLNGAEIRPDGAPSREELMHALAVVMLHLIEEGDLDGARKFHEALGHILRLPRSQTQAG